MARLIPKSRFVIPHNYSNMKNVLAKLLSIAKMNILFYSLQSQLNREYPLPDTRQHLPQRCSHLLPDKIIIINRERLVSRLVGSI
jgi:hypothetical protein